MNNIASWLSFSAALVSGFHEAELPLDDAKRVLHLGTDAYTIPQRGDTQWSQFAVAFRDVNPSGGQGLVVA